ncbi:MAG: DUF1521 domain-containing protein [Candidatus Eremiobacteraeota bacterium]|nr:DUF1521 domain-containing protein [Candidatus Eremiobacteraeota bacterium]
MAFPIGQNFGFDLRLNFGAGSMPGIGNTSLLPGFGSDGFSGSPFLNDFSSALGGLGTGFGNPMVGMSNLGGANPQQLLGLVSLLANLLGGQMNQGMGGPMNGCGGPGGFGGPGGCGGGPHGPGGFGGPGGPHGPHGPHGPGGGQGGVIELQKGGSFTTPSGSTISFKGDTVSVHESGGGSRNIGCGCGGAGKAGMEGRFAMAGRFSDQGFQGAMFMAANMSGGACGGVAGHQGAQHGNPRHWKVWGDPHINHPDGSKSDFDRKNAMFTLQDGTKVIMCADNPKATVNRVQIVLPGAQPNWKGIDPNQTSVMQDQGGRFKSVGTAAQMMHGGFGNFGGGTWV